MLSSTSLFLPMWHNHEISQNQVSKTKVKKKFTTETKSFIIKSIIHNSKKLYGIATQEKPTDPNDVIFYEVTMDSRQTDETFLVTGNIKDFPIKPFVVRPEEMMKIIEERRIKQGQTLIIQGVPPQAGSAVPGFRAQGTPLLRNSLRLPLHCLTQESSQGGDLHFKAVFILQKIKHSDCNISFIITIKTRSVPDLCWSDVKYCGQGTQIDKNKKSLYSKIILCTPLQLLKQNFFCL